MNKLIKKNLVIPMCGRGKRFRDGGYKSYKSMLQINYKNMLERIIQNFSCEEIDIYLITSDPIFTLFKSHKDWGKLKSKINLIKIKEHILGPAYSIYKAYSQIPKSRGTFISYCDITWHWDETIKPLELNDAAIFCHYGFHPHLIKDNYSAFCKPKKENPRELEEIKEKSSFTDNWMNEPLSVGLFYIKDISIIKKPLDLMIKDNKRVSNEFFPSLIFNYILNNNFKVNLIPVKSFVHYGTPSQFEDINDWSQYFFKKNINKDKTKIELYPSIIFASGKGNRMKKISKNNKALIKTGEKRLIDFVLDALPIKKSKTSIVFNDNEIKNHYKKYEINFFRIPKTNSQYESYRNDYRVYGSDNAGVNWTGKTDLYASHVGNFNSMEYFNNQQLLNFGPNAFIYTSDFYFWDWENDSIMRNKYDSWRNRRCYSSDKMGCCSCYIPYRNFLKSITGL